MEKVSMRGGVEVGGSKPATRFHPGRAEEDDSDPEIRFACKRAAEFLNNLIGDRRKEVALAYWPMPADAEQKWSGERIEAYVKVQLANLVRLLDLRYDRPPTIKFLFVCMKVLGPEAGVAIAHFFADEMGTERGAEKLNPKRVQDDLGTIKRDFQQVVGIVTSMATKIESLEKQAAAATRGQR